MFKLKSIKTQLILYLTCLALFLSIKDRNSAFLVSTVIAVLSAAVLDSAILYVKTKAVKITKSSLITGLITGFVFSSDEAWWRIAAVPALAILSKYLLRFRGKHIFNPAAFGIFLMLIVFHASTQWAGAYLWYLVVPFGLYFVFKIKKMELLIGYAAASLLLFGAQAAAHHISLWHIFGYFNYFYIFVMVIEPKTTPVKPFGKYAFGSGLAALIFMLTESGVRFDAELFSLLIMNITVPALNQLSFKKRGVS